MNAKETFLSYMNGDRDNWMGYAYAAMPKPYPFVIDPLTAAEIGHTTEEYTDWWGVPWRQRSDDPGAVPLNNASNAIIKDIEDWKDFVKFPDLSQMDFEGTRAQMKEINREDTLVAFPAYYGPFERIHTLMPFEDCLMAMYEEPEAFSDLMGAIVDWRIQALEPILDEFKPDLMHCHDDWGTAMNLMMSPDVFREVMKPHYERYYGFIKSKGVLVQHHNDGIGRGLEMDLKDMHIDMWQGVLEGNDINAMKARTGKDIVYMGGMDQLKIDRADITEEEVRAEVRRVIDAYGEGGCFLPCYPSVMPIHVPNLFIAMDEMERYGKEFMEKHQ